MEKTQEEESRSFSLIKLASTSLLPNEDLNHSEEDYDVCKSMERETTEAAHACLCIDWMDSDVEQTISGDVGGKLRERLAVSKAE